MTHQLIFQFLPLIPLFAFVGLVLLKVRRLRDEERRDPITTDIRYLPGSSLQDRLEKLSESRMDKVILVLLVGTVTALMIATRKSCPTALEWDWFEGSAFALSLAIAIYLAIKVNEDLPTQRKLKQGIRAEHATAQELAASLAGTNRIIHDVRAKDFNIDHVVITGAGVFAVETKSRLKPPAGSGSAAVKVKYNGKQLEFPGWVETKPIEQAARQAKWLADYLAQATGEDFPVVPVIALPGWFVENTARITENMVRVINPKKSQWLLLPERTRLDAGSIQRATFAIERLAQPDSTTST